MVEIQTWLYNNFYPLLVVILTPILTYFLGKRKQTAETNKINAETGKTLADAEKTEAEAKETLAKADQTKAETEAIYADTYRKLITDQNLYIASLLLRIETVEKTLTSRIEVLENCQKEKDDLVTKILKYERYFNACIKAFDYLAGVFYRDYPREIETARIMVSEYEKDIKDLNVK